MSLWAKQREAAPYQRGTRIPNPYIDMWNSVINYKDDLACRPRH
jgi:hypothetical protein